MRLESIYSIQNLSFQKKNKASKTSSDLNMGVLTPPDNLPHVSLYDSLYGTQNKTPIKSNTGGKKVTAGKLSAYLAFGTMGLSLVSLIAFLKGKK